MKIAYLNKLKDLQERRVLKAKIKLAKEQAELDVVEETLKAQPTMEGFEYATIE